MTTIRVQLEPWGDEQVAAYIKRVRSDRQILSSVSAPRLFVTLVATSAPRVCMYVQGGPEKNAQTLMSYNFSTAGHRVTRFPAKCSETTW